MGVDPQVLFGDVGELVDQVEPNRALHAEALALARREAAAVLP